MSFNQNYGVQDPAINDDKEILSDKEILEIEIENHIAEEQAEMENIQDNYRRLKYEEQSTSKTE